MIASVSIEILRKVKQALDIFHTDIADTAKRANQRMLDSLASGRMVLNEAEQAIQESQRIIGELQGRLSELESKIRDQQGREKQCQGRIDWLTSQILQLDSQIPMERSRLQSLQAQQAGASQEESGRIASEIAAKEQYIGTLETKRTNHTVERSGHYNEIKEIRFEIEKYRSERYQAENELEMQRGILQRRMEQRERLVTAYREMERDFMEYLSSLRSFESTQGDRTRNNRNAVEQCIAFIEEYLDTTL